MKTQDRFLSGLVANWTPLALIVGTAAVAGLLSLIPVVSGDVVDGLVRIMLVVGLYIYVGNSGEISFGHAAFVALGAYLGGVLTIPPIQRAFLVPGLPDWLLDFAPGLWVCIAIAAVAAWIVGYIVAIPLARLGGMAAAVATLAILLISQVLLVHWDVLSQGGGTIAGIPVDVGLPQALLGVVAAVIVAWLYQRSASGIRLRASRDDYVAARAVGIRVPRERRQAFALSTAVSAVGGALYVHTVGVLTASDYATTLAFIVLASLVIGGMGSLSGAVVGAALLAVLDLGMRRIQVGGGIGPIEFTLPNGVATVIIACLLVFMLIRRPSGVMRGEEFRAPTWLRTRAARGQGPATEAPETESRTKEKPINV